MSRLTQIVVEFRTEVEALLAELEATVATLEKVQGLAPKIAAAVDRAVLAPTPAPHTPAKAEKQEEREVTHVHLKRRKHFRVPQETLDELCRLHEAGVKPKQIHERIGLPYSTVCAQVAKLKKPQPTPKQTSDMDFRNPAPKQSAEDVRVARRQMLINAAKKQGNYRGL